MVMTYQWGDCVRLSTSIQSSLHIREIRVYLDFISLTPSAGQDRQWSSIALSNGSETNKQKKAAGLKNLQQRTDENHRGPNLCLGPFLFITFSLCPLVELVKQRCSTKKKQALQSRHQQDVLLSINLVALITG